MKESKVDDVQKYILKEHRSKQKIQVPEFDLQANQFVLADGREVRLTHIDCLYKKAIFKALNYVNYLFNFTDELSVTLGMSFRTHAFMFIRFVNELKLVKNSNTNLLKEFEVFRVDSGIKPQSTGAKQLRTSLYNVLGRDEFTADLMSSELDYLINLSETKFAPDADFVQCTLTNWFSEHTWLRRKDVGIGANLYALFTSPKTLMKSFNITTEISLLEIQKSKYALIAFFKQYKKSLLGLSTISIKEGKRDPNKKEIIVRANLNLLRVSYHKIFNPSEVLTNALSLLIRSFSFSLAKDSNESCFFANIKLTKYVEIEGSRISRFKNNDPILFSLDYIYELNQYAKDETRSKCPTSKAEHTLFQWMMASLCVQPSDVSKLRPCDLKVLRKGNGSVVSIEVEYYKGRARGYHATVGVRGNSKKGQALLNFIVDVTANFSEKWRYKALSPTPIKRCCHTIRYGYRCILVGLADTHIYLCIKKEHSKQVASNLIMTSLSKLSEYGLNYQGYKKEQIIKNKQSTYEGFLRNTETPIIKEDLFTLTHIKNSAVHAKSDYFDPTELLNYRSHSNETERKSYCTPANEEWKNNCGLITRAIMQDIYSNVYRLSDNNANIFNSEFMNALEAIEQRKKDTLARLKLVTGKEGGEIVDELGIRKVKTARVENFLMDNIYIIDSAETVMKLKHYIFEAETNYKYLLESAPTFLFNTVLPTVEWIESLFSDAKFSKNSIVTGKDLFNKYADILPPIFQSHGAK